MTVAPERPTLTVTRLLVMACTMAGIIAGGCGTTDDDRGTAGANVSGDVSRSSDSADAAVSDTAVSDDEVSDDEFGRAIAEALGAGGGGTLSFDGEDIAIDSVACFFDGDLFDVGTVSDSGHRVLLSWTSVDHPVSIQVLDGEFRQWFPEGDPALDRSVDRFTSSRRLYWANGTDDTIEVGFTIECP